jgi:hypothetical protein
VLSFVQEVAANGDDGIADVYWAAHDGALTVESDKGDGSVGYG